MQIASARDEGPLTKQEVAYWLKESKDAERLAEIIYQRYCAEKPRQYRYLGRELGITGASKVVHLERTALQRLRQPPALGRVEVAGKRVPRGLWVALFGAWKPQEVKR